jgi:hypothetical protein
VGLRQVARTRLRCKTQSFEGGKTCTLGPDPHPHFLWAMLQNGVTSKQRVSLEELHLCLSVTAVNLSLVPHYVALPSRPCTAPSPLHCPLALALPSRPCTALSLANPLTTPSCTTGPQRTERTVFVHGRIATPESIAQPDTRALQGRYKGVARAYTGF